MSWTENENAARAARMERDQAWREHFGGERREGVPALPRCNCGCQGEPAPPPYPDGLGIAPESSQPAAVLLAAHLARRNADPLTVAEEARDTRAAELAGRLPRLDGREALRRLETQSREPGGGTLAGSHARALIRQLEIRHHWDAP
jgi:hypothetical protein